MKTFFALSWVALLASGQSETEFKTDDQGFIRNWLILAPIPSAASDNGADEVDKEQIKDEAKLAPKAGDKVTVGKKELTWKAYQASNYVIDFNTFLEKMTTDSVAYALCTVVAEEEMKDLQMRVGTNDEAKIYLNGKEVFKWKETRPLEKDENIIKGLTLNKGANSLIFKIINEGRDWEACVRFADKDGQAVKTLKIRLGAS